MTPRRALAALALAVAASVPLVAACDVPASSPVPAAEDCDREDLRNREDDCGYWAADGVFEYWHWVTPGVGGHAPPGWRPSVPPGGSTRRPPNARPSATPRVQSVPVPAPVRPTPGGRAGSGATARPAPPRPQLPPVVPRPPAPRPRR